MNELKIFENEEFGSIREMNIDGEPWFVGKDVAKALGYTNPQKAIREHIDDEDKTVNDLFTVNGTGIKLINESGLYSLIMSSKLPNAKRFKRWVTAEVLPSIRKNGGYGDVGAIVSECVKEVMAQIMPVIEAAAPIRDEGLSEIIKQNALMLPRGKYSNYKVYNLPDELLVKLIKGRLEERKTYNELEDLIRCAGGDVSRVGIFRFFKSIKLIECRGGAIEILTRNNEVLRIGEDGRIKRILG